jgi:F-type H+-transporting ATPase subunit a
VSGNHSYFSYAISSLYENQEIAQYLPDVERLSFGVLLGGLLVVGGRALSRRISTQEGQAAAIIPEKRLSAFSVTEAFLEGCAKFYDTVLGEQERQHGGRRRVHLPFILSIFLFVLIANLIGLIPGMPSVTNTVWVNVGMALVVFVYFNVQGFKAHGVAGYLKHFCGPIVLLAPFMFVLEIFSICLRVLTLNLRLYWNIKADHVVVSTFTDLLPPGIPVVFYVMGTFVCFMQAFIFSTLTMVYILLATQHDEEHAEGHTAKGH